MTEPRAREPLRAGQRLGEWVLEAPLGKGGFGEVWRAKHNALGDVVAVKVPFEPSHASRLRSEGLIQHALESPRIVRTLGLDPDHAPPYLVVEYVAGESLRERLARGRLEPAQALFVAREILLALEAAHAAGVVHRDLKPENVLLEAKQDAALNATGQVKVADFGFGTLVEGAARDLLASGSLRTGEGHDIVGTVRYMAPEQRDPKGPVDARADVYAWGIVFYEMLTGEVPCGAEVPSQVVPGLDPRLDQIFRRAYARRESRYATAAAARADLEAVLASPAHEVAARDPVLQRAASDVAPRAGVVARAVALAIDALPFLWLGAETETIRYVVPLFLLYDVASVATFGRTAGKALVGLRVRDASGGPPSFAAAVSRALARGLSLAAAGLGCLPALGREKQALHDRVAGTVVTHEV